MGKLQKIGDEKVAYKGKIIEIVNQKMSDGTKTITFEWARRAPGVRLILINPANRTILLTKEHRYELGADDYRLPGGKVFDKLSQYSDLISNSEGLLKAALQKAHDEAEEEAGVRVESLVYYYTSVCGTTVQWDLIYFASEQWSRVDQKLELGEQIGVEEVSFEEAQKIALDGRMSEERSALVLLRYLSSKA